MLGPLIWKWLSLESDALLYVSSSLSSSYGLDRLSICLLEDEFVAVWLALVLCWVLALGGGSLCGCGSWYSAGFRAGHGAALVDVRSHLQSLAFRVDGALVLVDLQARGSKERAPGRVVVGSVGMVPGGPFGHDSNNAECSTVPTCSLMCPQTHNHSLHWQKDGLFCICTTDNWTEKDICH